MIYENVVKEARKQGISLTVLEEKAGLGNGTIGKWKTSVPNIGTLQKVAAALSVPLSRLLKEAS